MHISGKLFNHSMSEMMIATMRLTMIIEPRMMSPTSRNIVYSLDLEWEDSHNLPDFPPSYEVELSELFQRSSNSNSPRTITNIFRKDLPILSNDSVSFPK